ncbi:MAG TPA: cytochrome c [Candidatus Acidoferrum sp.]|nr:cytochrome c [Candidatus Acidoferrum sp.]
MRTALACFSLTVLAATSFGFGKQQATQEKPAENPPAAADAAKPASANRKNPVAPTAESLAAAKKMFGYDCAMCHGAAGDGKGDMVESMKLTMKDWRDPQSLGAVTDGEIFDIITKGKGKMTGEGDRLPAEKVWGMVNYVRALAKKGGAATSADAAPKQ